MKKWATLLQGVGTKIRCSQSRGQSMTVALLSPGDVVPFNYEYMDVKEKGGKRRPPSPLPHLIAEHRVAALQAQAKHPGQPIVLVRVAMRVPVPSICVETARYTRRSAAQWVAEWVAT